MRTAMGKLATAGLGVAVGIAGGLLTGWLFFGHNNIFGIASWNTDFAGEIRSGTGKLTNPLLECNVAQGIINAPKINFDPDLEDFSQRISRNGSVDEIAVYFRDLNNGPAFGIHEDIGFIPASLLKVPIMMAYFKSAETDPNLLNKEVLAENLPDSNGVVQLVAPEHQLREGEMYTVEELIERMIKYSDNRTVFLLSKLLPIENQISLYTMMGVDPSIITDPAGTITVRQYSSFLRILFNSSFLSQAYSEKALSILTESAFNSGLRAGVPRNIAIAHKFGERSIDGGREQLHDCGIIYYPKHPYLLCVMTRGSDIPALEKAIAAVSGFVYGKVESQYAK